MWNRTALKIAPDVTVTAVRHFAHMFSLLSLPIIVFEKSLFSGYYIQATTAATA